MKTYEELTTYIANLIIHDKKQNINNTLQFLNLQFVYWIYEVSHQTLYYDVMQKVAVDDLK